LPLNTCACAEEEAAKRLEAKAAEEEAANRLEEKAAEEEAAKRLEAAKRAKGANATKNCFDLQH